MAVGGVDHYGVYTCFYKRVNTLDAVGSHTDSGCHTQTSETVLACHRFVLCLCYILVCNQTDEMAFAVNHG